MRLQRWGVALALTTALVASARFAAAQSPMPLQSFIKKGFQAAWARHPEHRAANARREAAALGLSAAQRWMPEAPSLELSTKTDRLTRNRGGREYEATVAAPLWRLNERSSAHAAAAADAAALETRLAAAQWRLAGEVREVYWAHQRALIDLELAKRRHLGAQRLAADVGRRVTAGDLARSDGHQAETAVAAAESALAEAAIALSNTGQNWTAVTGQQPAELEDTVAESMREEVMAAADHFELQELQGKADAARRQRDLAGAQTRGNAEITVGASRERGEFGEQYSQALVFGVRIPLGVNGGSQARIAGATADQLDAEAQLSLAQERVQVSIRAARQRLAVHDVALAAAQRRERLAGESRGFYEKSFLLGESDLPTRLRVELEVAEAERQAARARVERAAAVSQLNQSLGLLPE